MSILLAWAMIGGTPTPIGDDKACLQICSSILEEGEEVDYHRILVLSV